MKIACLSTGFPRNQTDHYGLFVYLSLRSLPNCDVEILVPGGADLPGQEQFGRLHLQRFTYFWPPSLQTLAYRSEGIVSTIKSSWWAKATLPIFLLTFLCRSFSVIRRADVVHAQWLPTGLLALLPCRLLRKPLIVTVRGADMRMARNSSFGRMLSAWMVRLADRVLTVNEEFTDYLRALAPPKIRERIGYLPNGVDQERFFPQARENARQQLGLPPVAAGAELLAIGHFSRVKGFDLLLQALAEIPQVRLHLLGDGVERPALEKQIRDLGLAQRVCLLGEVKNHQLPMWYNAVDALVIPSRNEGRPNVLLEALACGLPVITTEIPGVLEILPADMRSYSVEPGNAVALAQVIQRFLQEIPRARSNAKNGPQHLQQLGLTWPEHGKKLQAIYEAVRNSRG